MIRWTHLRIFIFPTEAQLSIFQLFQLSLQIDSYFHSYHCYYSLTLRISVKWQNIDRIFWICFLVESFKSCSLTKTIPWSIWNPREYVWDAILNWWTPGDTVIYAHELHPFPYSAVFPLLLRYTVNRSRCGCMPFQFGVCIFHSLSIY